MKVYIVRHARAERRVGWDGPDPLRPLAPRGLLQSTELAARLAREGVKHIVSSPHLRCIQTMEPLASLANVPIGLDERLAEGGSAFKACELLEEVRDEPIALCSHGDLIPELMTELENRGVELDLDGPFRCQKASVWLLEGDDGLPRRASYWPTLKTEMHDDDAAERLAVLDLGSTSFRLVLFEATAAGRLRQLVNERVMLRLGAAIAATGRISDANARRAAAAARRLAKLARNAGASRLLPVATAALRDAENGADLAARIGEVIGTPVRVVSGREEARLLFTAARRRVLLGSRTALCIDLGGGSLELVVGDSRGIHWDATLKIGVTRLHRELVKRDPMRKRHVRRVRERLLAALEPHLAAIAELAPSICIVTGGTARAFARLSVARGDQFNGSGDQRELSVKELARLTRKLVRLDYDQRCEIPGIRKSRADLLPTGGILLTTLAETLGVESYTVCDWGLREGVALDALGFRGAR